MNFIGKVQRIVVGISGGVDSAIAAYLLKKRGYDVIGLYMRNWDIIDELGFCSGEKDRSDAEEVCSILNIPFYEVNFVREYWTEVFDDFLNDYKNGLTPNPDILCNKNIKFKHFLQVAVNKFGADAIATGHYARKSYSELDGARLFKARDYFKDQTFFLSQIPQLGLRKSIFPLGDMIKSEVKNLARENKLEKFANKKESYGICFIGNRNFKEFISEYVSQRNGKFIDIDTGKVVGEHNGKHNFTIGQRCKIPSMLNAYFVAKKSDNEDIYVAMGHNHPALFDKTFSTMKPIWIHSEPKELRASSRFVCNFRFQHRKPLVSCAVSKLYPENDCSGLFIDLEKPLRAITPGQYAVLYKGSECLGSARIHTVACCYSHETDTSISQFNRLVNI